MTVISKFLTCNKHFTFMSVMWCRCATTEACPGFFFTNVFLASIGGVWRASHLLNALFKWCMGHLIVGSNVCFQRKNSGFIISSVRGNIFADTFTWLRKHINLLHVGMIKSHAILIVLHAVSGMWGTIPIFYLLCNLYIFYTRELFLFIAATIMHNDYLIFYLIPTSKFVSKKIMIY